MGNFGAVEWICEDSVGLEEGYSFGGVLVELVASYFGDELIRFHFIQFHNIKFNQTNPYDTTFSYA
jgi:hypothetical protein